MPYEYSRYGQIRDTPASYCAVANRSHSLPHQLLQYRPAVHDVLKAAPMNNVHFAVILLLTPPAKKKQPKYINLCKEVAHLFKKRCSSWRCPYSDWTMTYPRVFTCYQIIKGSRGPSKGSQVQQCLSVSNATGRTWLRGWESWLRWDNLWDRQQRGSGPQFVPARSIPGPLQTWYCDGKPDVCFQTSE
jgi:hypothetical protein